MFNKAHFIFYTILISLLSTQALIASPVLGSTPAEFNVANGTANYSIPISVAPGRGGMQPELSLDYSSSGGNGILGIGWNLGGVSKIQRCPATFDQDGFISSINFNENDRYCLDGQRLIPINGIDGGLNVEYRTEIDSYSKITSHGGTINNPAYWKVKTKSGQVITYGDAPGISNDASLKLSQGTIAWAVQEINDTTSNNPITFDYSIDQNTQYLGSITYTGGRVDFTYGPRPDDNLVSYFLGNKIVLSQRLDKIITYSSNISNGKLKEYRVDYDNTGFNQISKIDSITTCDKFGNCFKDTLFDWKTSVDNHIDFPSFQLNGLNTFVNSSTEGASIDISRIKFGDFDGDGRTDIYYINGYQPGGVLDKIHLSNGDGTYSVIDGVATQVYPNHGAASVDISRINFGDFNGDGRTDIYWVGGYGDGGALDTIHLSKGDGTYTVIDGLVTEVRPSHSGASIDISRINFGDFDGDGRTDIYHIKGNQSGGVLDTIHLSNGDGTYTVIDGLVTSVYPNHSAASVDISRINFGDFDGDGRTDIYYINGYQPGGVLDTIHLSNGDGTYRVINGIVTQVYPNHGAASVDISRINFGDFNGDGLADIYWVGGYGYGGAPDIIHLSKGDGTYTEIDGLVTEVRPSHSGASIDISRIKFGDFNVDGLTDIYYVNGNQPGGVLDKVHLSKGDGTYTEIDGLATQVHSDHGYASVDISRINFGDFNGDGKPDVYYVDGFYTAQDTIYTNNYTSTELNSITDSNGNTTSITYKPLSDSSIYTKGTGSQYPYRDLQFAQYVVSQVESSNGVGGATTVNYHYEGLKAHMRGRGILGYRKITETYPDTQKSKETLFYQYGGIYERNSTTDFKPDGTPFKTSFPYSGGVEEVIESYNGYKVNESINTYYESEHPTLDNIYQLSLYENIQRSYELGNDTTPVTTVATTHEYIDDEDVIYGNIGRVTVTTEGGGQSFSKITDSNYTNDTSQDRWHLGRLTDTTVTHQSPYGPDEVRASDFDYYGDTGLLKTERILSTQTGQPLTTTTYTYDAYGQKTQVTLSAAGEQDRVTTTAYNDVGKPIQSCNVYNQCETYTYTPEGWLESTTGPNGITTTWTYDGFGRKIREDRADGTWTTIERYFADSGNWGEDELAPFAYTCTVSQSSGTQPSIVQFDRLGRKVRKITQSFDDRQVYSDTEYNHLAQVSRVSRDYYPGNHIYWATSEYDALERVIRATEPGPHGTTNEIITQYNGLTTTVISGPDARAKTTITNAIGQKVRINEEEGAYTEYTYNSDGNLLTTRVAGIADTTITLEYDEFGRKIGMTDPAMGQWSYTYNAFSELVSQTDAKGQTVTMEYDLLGRTIQRTDPEGVSVWTYGDNNASPGSVGKLLQEVGHGMIKDYSYDSLGRPASVTTSIDGEGSFTSYTEYDSLGRVSRTTYPGTQGFFTENVYNGNGFLSAIQGLRSQAESHDYSQLQPLIQEAVNLADEYLLKAEELKEIGEFYQTRIDNYTILLANQTIQFESGTTTGLSRNVAYDYLHAGDGTTAYIRVPDTFIPIGIDNMFPIILPAEYHYRVQEDTDGNHAIIEITAAEFDAVEATLTDNGDQIYVLNDNTITCACDSVGHDQYVANLQEHQALLQETITQSQTTDSLTHIVPIIYGNIIIPLVHQQQAAALPPELLNHINNTLVELQAVQSLIEQQVQSYADTFDQLVVLTEQTLAAADHHFQIERTLDDSAIAYAEMIVDNDTITYWKAVDVDASGRISAEVYGNGIVNDYAYNQATGQLQSIHNGLLASNPIRHLEYQYDAYQNVTSRHDWVNDIRETYSYDRLDSLVSSEIRSDFYNTQDFNTIQSLTYDVLGNITSKSDVGEYTYGGASPHAVTQAGENTYTYDANGNMVSGAGRTIQWSSFNKPTEIIRNGRSATFSYGSDRGRYKKINHLGETTLYIGGLYEKTTRGDNIEQKHYIYAAGQMVAEHILSTEDGVQTRYLHKDALGSIDLVTDAYANVVERRSFDPWGKLRDLPWGPLELDDPLYLTQLPFTDRGYTGHEHIQEVELIHMNGRLYDATLARFISPDPHIQADSLSQNYNRYSYVMNNPMKYTDPSGYFFKKLFKGVKKALKKAWNAVRPYVGIIVGAALFLSPWGAGFGSGFWSAVGKGATFGAIAGAAGAAAVGGDIFQGAALGALSGAVFGGIGAHFSSTGMSCGLGSGIYGSGGHIAAHAFAGGALSEIQGGKFGHGFASAGFAKFATVQMSRNGIMGMDSTEQDFGRVLQRTATAAVVGGTASAIGGGKFSNGARTAAVAHLFNEESRRKLENNQRKRLGLSETEARLVIKNTFQTDGNKHHLIRGLPDELTVQHVDFAEEILARMVDADYLIDVVGDVGIGGMRGAAKHVLKGFFKGVSDYDTRQEMINTKFENFDIGAGARNVVSARDARRLDMINRGLW